MRLPRFLLPPAHDPETRSAFLRSSVATNLMRIEIVVFLIALCAFANPFQADAFHSFHTGWGQTPRHLALSLSGTPVAVGELIACGLIYLFIALVRRLPSSTGLRQRAVYIYVAFGFFHADFWFFFVQAPVPLYWCSLIGVATILILPPRLAAGLMIANHLLVVGLLALIHPVPSLFFTLTLGTTLGLLFSIPVSWFLFGKQEQAFLWKQTIIRQNRELAQARAEMEEVMAIAAHDMRSPLYGLQDLLQMWATLPNLSKEQANGIYSQADRACDNLLSLVSRLLEAYTIDSEGHSPLDVPPVDVRYAFQAAVERTRHLPGEGRLDIVLDLARAGEHWANPAVLAQVLDNLLSNAVRHSPEGGRITVMLEALPHGWRGEIRDEGDGIPESERGKLFQKFYRGSHPGKSKRGTGLGLFIVRKRMESLGGRVGYEPGTPKGSIFWMEMRGTA